MDYNRITSFVLVLLYLRIGQFVFISNKEPIYYKV